jgi:hypothetical protein
MQLDVSGCVLHRRRGGVFMAGFRAGTMVGGEGAEEGLAARSLFVGAEAHCRPP